MPRTLPAWPRSALAAQLSHPEVAGLLAEAISEQPILVVLDDAERLATSPDALEVVAAFARYLPHQRPDGDCESDAALVQFHRRLISLGGRPGRGRPGHDG